MSMKKFKDLRSSRSLKSVDLQEVQAVLLKVIGQILSWPAVNVSVGKDTEPTLLLVVTGWRL